MMSGRPPSVPRTSYQIVAPFCVNVCPGPEGWAGRAAAVEGHRARAITAATAAECERRKPVTSHLQGSIENLMKRPADVVHVDGVARLLPEEPSVIGADDQTVRFDVERVELRPRFRLRSVDVPRIDLARELLREPAHGGL